MNALPHEQPRTEPDVTIAELVRCKGGSLSADVEFGRMPCVVCGGIDPTFRFDTTSFACSRCGNHGDVLRLARLLGEPDDDAARAFLRGRARPSASPQTMWRGLRRGLEHRVRLRPVRDALARRRAEQYRPLKRERVRA